MKAYLKAIAYELPETVVCNDINSRLTKKTGIYKRHIAGIQECASDLAVKAAEKLFAQGVDRNSIDYLLLCTQSPDFILPTTACLLQDRLRLGKNCGALDYNLGCSGYIYGLSLAKGLIESGQAKQVLLLTAETYSKYIEAGDSSVEPMFGDGATVSLIAAESAEEAGVRGLVFGTDGSGYEHLIVKMGAARNPYGNLFREKDQEDGKFLKMKGALISQFALEVVPDTIEQVLAKSGLEKKSVDYFVLHQANRFMLDFIQMKCALQESPFWNHVEEYGNTVSNSIPLALCDLLKTRPNLRLENVLLVGFGVGLSWGGCIVDLRYCEV